MNNSFIIFLAILLMLIPAFGIILFVVMYQRRMMRHQRDLKKINEEQERSLIEASIKGEEHERIRISSELHDDIGARLSSVRLLLKQTDNPENPSFALIRQAITSLDEGINRIRSLSHELHPVTLQHLGLKTALLSFVEMIGRNGPIKVKFESNTEIPRLEEGVELTVYRIFQELINNVIKHSAATFILLEMSHEREVLLIMLTHNGKGMSQGDFQEFTYKRGAIGLKNIVNRLNSIAGKIEFLKGEDVFKVNVTVDISAKLKAQ